MDKQKEDRYQARFEYNKKVQETLAMQMQDRDERRAKMVKDRQELALKAIPEPVVLKHDVAVKAMCLVKATGELIIGLESGQVRILNADSFEVLHECKMLDTPILNIC